jgi:Zn-dependent peptidase ImmA (M78 family)
VADRLRKEMQLTQIDRFDPFEAAEDLGIPVHPFAMLIDDPNSMEAMLLREGRVSAMTIFVTRHRRAVFYDDARAAARIVSDLAHELAHALLFHPAHSVSVSELGCAGIDRAAEEEAAHLSGVLLVSDEGALHALQQDLAIEEACDLFGVSEQMMRYRINVSGARIRHDRRRQHAS